MLRRLRLAALLMIVLGCAPAALWAQDTGDPGDATGDTPDNAPAVTDPSTDAQGASGAAPTLAQVLHAAAVVRQNAMPDLERAFALLAARSWSASIAPFLSVVEQLESQPLLAGLRDQCLYNVACAYARTDEPERAVEFFGRSVEHGLRPVQTPTTDGRLTISPGLTLAHLLVDSDLDVLRDRDDFRSLLDPLLRGGAPVVEATPAATLAVTDGTRVPGLIVLLSEDRDVAEGGAPWRTALAETPALICFVEGPVRPLPITKRWLLSDGDERFAVRRVLEALDLLRADPRVDPARIVLAAASPLAAEAGLSATLDRAADVAGLVLGPFVFHAAWHADALARLGSSRREEVPWSVRLVQPRGRAAAALHEAGAAVTEIAELVEQGADVSTGTPEPGAADQQSADDADQKPRDPRVALAARIAALRATVIATAVDALSAR